jgi:prophage regulatory protein
MSNTDTILVYDELPPAARFSKPHLRRLEAAGRFPRRVPIGPKRHGWVAAEISEYLRGCIASRDQGGAK